MADTKGAPQQDQSLLRKIGRANAITIVISFAISVYIIYALLADPFNSVRIVPFTSLFFVGIVLFNRVLNAIKDIFLHSPGWLLSGLLDIANLIVNVVASVALIVVLNQAADAREMTLAKRYLQPVIAQIEVYRKQTGSLPQKLVVSSTSAKKPGFRYFHDLDNYIIATNGSSIDIDGTTIYYLSTTRKWRHVHNDLFALTNPPEPIKKFLSLKQHMVFERY
jgi:type II secretory pathway pseudopilin PulG